MSAESSKPTVVEALAEVAKSIAFVAKAGKADQRSGGYNYRRIDDVLAAVHGPLAEHGVVIVPQVEHWATEPYHGYSSGSWTITQLRVRYVVHGPAGDSVDVVAVGEGIDNGDKGTGKAMSYAYKSAITQLLALPTDDPAMDVEHNPAPSEARTPIRAQRKRPKVDDDDPDRREAMREAIRNHLASDEQAEVRDWMIEQDIKLNRPTSKADLDRLDEFIDGVFVRDQKADDDADGDA